MLFAAAAILAASPQSTPVSQAAATASAQATIRIVSGAVIRLGEGLPNGSGPRAKVTLVRLDGTSLAAKLVEFE
jgi:hypothetical protein